MALLFETEYEQQTQHNPALDRARAMLLAQTIAEEGHGHTLADWIAVKPPRGRSRDLASQVEQHWLAAQSVEELAFLCHMSLSALQRKFSDQFDQSPDKWLTDKRLNLAKHWITHDGLRPSEVWNDLGYRSHSAFTAAFKAEAV